MADRPAIYARTIRCRLDQAAFEAFNLYSSARDKFMRTDEMFDVPYFENPKADPTYVNYLLLEVRVCPRCYFASNEPGHFDTDSQWVKPVPIQDKTLKKLIESFPARRAIASAAATLASAERTPDDALTSYKLGIQCATAMHASDPDHLAVEVVRAANYAMRAARLCQEGARPEEERLNWMRIALGYLRKALEADLGGVLLYKSLYQLGALGVYLKDDWAIGRAYESMRKLYYGEPTHELTAYYSRLRRLWGDREEIRAGP